MQAPTPPPLSASVVICTYNRASHLDQLLTELKHQTYAIREVIVVNGPSTDETEQIAKQHDARYVTAPKNLSIARNIGILHSSSDIVVFIDDDAIPDSAWLENLIRFYDSERVASVGGFVYYQRDKTVQYSYAMIDRFGRLEYRQDRPYDFNQPFGRCHNVNVGVNMSFRRSALLEVGGFDEWIEWGCEDTDLCVRLIDVGYAVVQNRDAVVYHTLVPSSFRDDHGTVSNWAPIVKNATYTSVKHSRGIARVGVIAFLAFWNGSHVAKWLGRSLTGKCTVAVSMECARAICMGYVEGLWKGLVHQRRLMNPEAGREGCRVAR